MQNAIADHLLIDVQAAIQPSQTTTPAYILSMAFCNSIIIHTIIMEIYQYICICMHKFLYYMTTWSVRLSICMCFYLPEW